MSIVNCFKSASAKVESGTTGFLLVVKVIGVPSGFVPPSLNKGELPFDPKNVFPVIIVNSVQGATNVDLEITHNLGDKNEFDFVKLFCGDISEHGTLIPVDK